MITLRKLKIEDYEDVVDMYYMFITEVFHDRKISSKYFFYKEVTEWIRKGKDIVLATDGDTILGFSCCVKDNMMNLTEDVYLCEYCYVKEQYRKGRSAYLLYNNAHNYAMENNMKIQASGRIENGVSKMIQKHFGLEPRFTTLEG